MVLVVLGSAVYFAGQGGSRNTHLVASNPGNGAGQTGRTTQQSTTTCVASEIHVAQPQYGVGRGIAFFILAVRNMTGTKTCYLNGFPHLAVSPTPPINDVTATGGISFDGPQPLKLSPGKSAWFEVSFASQGCVKNDEKCFNITGLAIKLPRSPNFVPEPAQLGFAASSLFVTPFQRGQFVLPPRCTTRQMHVSNLRTSPTFFEIHGGGEFTLTNASTSTCLLGGRQMRLGFLDRSAQVVPPVHEFQNPLSVVMQSGGVQLPQFEYGACSEVSDSRTANKSRCFDVSALTVSVAPGSAQIRIFVHLRSRRGPRFLDYSL